MKKSKIDKENTSNAWLTKYYLLKEYLEVFREYPKKTERYKGVILASWVVDQRRKFH